MSRLDGSGAVLVAQGATVSSKLYLGGAVPYALTLPPANYVAGNITFNGSIDGTTFYPLYVADGGTEALYTITSTGTGAKTYALDGTKFAGLNAIQIVTAAAQTNVGGVIFEVGLRDL